MLFHLNDYSPDNTLFSKFIRKLRKRLTAKYKINRLGYLWVREQGKREPQHCHLALFLNGSKVQTSHAIFDLCVDIWEGWNQPRPASTAKRCYHQLRRDSSAEYAEVFYHLSYMAKTNTKGERPSSTNDYSASLIKVKNQVTSVVARQGQIAN